MSFKYGSLLSTAFSAVVMAASTIATPINTEILDAQTPVVQPVKEAFKNADLHLCAMERRRWLYDACTNTLIETNIAAAAHQEVPTAPKLG